MPKSEQELIKELFPQAYGKASVENDGKVMQSGKTGKANEQLNKGMGPVKVQPVKQQTPIADAITPNYGGAQKQATSAASAANAEVSLRTPQSSSGANYRLRISELVPTGDAPSIMPKQTAAGFLSGGLKEKQSDGKKNEAERWVKVNYKRTPTVDAIGKTGTKIGRYRILSEKEYDNGGFGRDGSGSYDSYVRNVLGHIKSSSDKSESDGASKYLDEISRDEQGIKSVPLTKFGLMTEHEYRARGGKDYDRYINDETSKLISQKKAIIDDAEEKIKNASAYTYGAGQNSEGAIKEQQQKRIDAAQADLDILEAERGATDSFKSDEEERKYSEWKMKSLGDFIRKQTDGFSPDDPKSVSDFITSKIRNEFNVYPKRSVSGEIGGRYNFENYIDGKTIKKDAESADDIKYASRFLSENPEMITGSRDKKLNREVGDYFGGFSLYYDSIKRSVEEFNETQNALGGKEFYKDKERRKNALEILDGKTSFNGADFGLLTREQYDERYPQTARGAGEADYLDYLFEGITENLSEMKGKAEEMSYHGMVDKYGDWYKKNFEAAKSLAYALDMRNKIRNAEGKDGIMSREAWETVGKGVNLSYEDYLSDVGTDESTARYTKNLYDKLKPIGEMESDEDEVNRRLRTAKIIVDTYDMENKYLGKEFENTEGGQFKANYALGSLGIESNKLWYEYAQTGNRDALNAAKRADEITEEFSRKNRTIIEDENKNFKWITKSLAQHIPQEIDQARYGAVPAIIGGTIGIFAGHPFMGARLGMSVGSVGEGYVQMVGDAMRSMVNAGLDYDEAKELATNEGIINSVIESGGEIVDIAVDFAIAGVGMGDFFSGKLSALGEKGLMKLGVSGKTAKKAVKAATTGGALLTGAAGEGAEEVEQSMVSKANERIAKNIAAGKLESKDMLHLLGEASNLSLYSDEDWKEMFGQDGWEGFKVGLMMSAIHGGGIKAANSVTNLLQKNTASQIGASLHSEGMESPVILNALMYGDDATKDMVRRYEKVVTGEGNISEKGDKAKKLLGEIFKATQERVQSETKASEKELNASLPLKERLKTAASSAAGRVLGVEEQGNFSESEIDANTAANRITEGRGFENDIALSLSDASAKAKVIRKLGIDSALGGEELTEAVRAASKERAKEDISASLKRAKLEDADEVSALISNISETPGAMRRLSSLYTAADRDLKSNIAFTKEAGLRGVLNTDLAILSGNKNYIDEQYIRSFADMWAKSAEKSNAWVLEKSGMNTKDFSDALSNYVLGNEDLPAGGMRRIADGMKAALTNHVAFLSENSGDGFFAAQAESLKQSVPLALAVLETGSERGALINRNLNDYTGGTYYDYGRRNYGNSDYAEGTSDNRAAINGEQGTEHGFGRDFKSGQRGVRQAVQRTYTEGERRSFKDGNGNEISYTEVEALDENSKAIADYTKLFGYDCQFAKGLNADGYPLNGMRRGKTIYLDIENESIKQTQGHELLHAIKQKVGGGYAELRSKSVSFIGMEKFGVIRDRYIDLYRELYSKNSFDEMTDAEKADMWDIIDEEIMADIVGFVRDGDTESLMDIFGYSIESVSDILDTVNAILDEGKGVPASDENADVKFSVGYTEDNKPVAVIDDDILKNVPRNDWVDTVKEVIKNKFSTGIPVGGRLIKVNKITRKEFTGSKNSEYLSKYRKAVYEDKFRGANHLDDIVLSATNFINEDLNHTRSDNITEFARGDVLMRVGKNDYKAKVVVGFTSGKSMVLYDVVDFVPTTIKLKKMSADTGTKLRPNSARQTSSTNNIPQNSGNVNTNVRKNSENITEKSENGKNSTRFQAKAPIEEAKNLIAVHNINEDKLYGALELGGFPMPSIAVTKSGDSHEGFGDITVLFGKETIDPKQSSDNKVFGGDAYTPMFPTVEYEADKNVENKLYAKYIDIMTKYGSEAARGLYKYAENTEDVLNSEKGEKGIIEAAKNDTALMRTFLYDAGVGEVKTIKKEKTEKISEAKAEQYDYFIEKLGKEAFSELVKREPGVSVFEAKRNWAKKYMPRFDEALKGYFSEKLGLSDEQTSNILNAETTSSKLATARAVLKYINNGKEITVTEPDYTATNESIEKTAQEKGFDAWVDGLLGGIEKTKGIRNGKDPFMPDGHRRSFAQLHNEYTLDNIVKQMRSELQKGQGSLFTGIAQLKGAATKEYGSISEIKADSGRLTADTSAIDDLSNEWYNIADGIVGESGDAIAHMNRIENLTGDIVEAVNETKTAEAFKKKLMNDNFYNITEEAADKIYSFLNRLREIPVKYFEAKPQRAIGFDEVKAVFVPDNTSPDLITRIKDNGMRVVDYKKGDIADRTAKINDFADSEDVKFQASGTGSRKINDLFKKLTDSIPLMVDDDIVYSATGNEFEVGKKKLSRQVYEYFDSLGGVVHRDGFGDVAINDKGVDSSIAHGMGRAKAIAFASVPEVIRKGRQIDFAENWKGRNYDTYVFAAPIQIGTQKAFVGVVVTKNGTDNRYYLHEVSDNDGNIIIIKKDDVSFKSKSETADNSNPLGETSSTNIISQEAQNVNTENTKYQRGRAAKYDTRTVEEKEIDRLQHEVERLSKRNKHLEAETKVSADGTRRVEGSWLKPITEDLIGATGTELTKRYIAKQLREGYERMLNKPQGEGMTREEAKLFYDLALEIMENTYTDEGERFREFVSKLDIGIDPKHAPDILGERGKEAVKEAHRRGMKIKKGVGVPYQFDADLPELRYYYPEFVTEEDIDSPWQNFAAKAADWIGNRDDILKSNYSYANEGIVRNETGMSVDEFRFELAKQMIDYARIGGIKQYKTLADKLKDAKAELKARGKEQKQSEKVISSLTKENARLKEAADIITKNMQLTRAGEKRIADGALRKIVKGFKQMADSTVKTGEFGDIVKELFSAVINREENGMTDAEISAIAKKAASKLIGGTELNGAEAEQQIEVYSDLLTAAMSGDDSFKTYADRLAMKYEKQIQTIETRAEKNEAKAALKLAEAESKRKEDIKEVRSKEREKADKRVEKATEQERGKFEERKTVDGIKNIFRETKDTVRREFSFAVNNMLQNGDNNVERFISAVQMEVADIDGKWSLKTYSNLNDYNDAVKSIPAYERKPPKAVINFPALKNSIFGIVKNKIIESLETYADRNGISLLAPDTLDINGDVYSVVSDIASELADIASKTIEAKTAVIKNLVANMDKLAQVMGVPKEGYGSIQKLVTDAYRNSFSLDALDIDKAQRQRAFDLMVRLEKAVLGKLKKQTPNKGYYNAYYTIDDMLKSSNDDIRTTAEAAKALLDMNISTKSKSFNPMRVINNEEMRKETGRTFNNYKEFISWMTDEVENNENKIFSNALIERAKRINKYYVKSNSVNSLSMNQINEILETVPAFLKQLANQNALINSEVNEKADIAARRVIGDIPKLRTKTEVGDLVQRSTRRAWWDWNVVFNRLAHGRQDSPLYKLAYELTRANTYGMNTYKMDAYAHIEKFTDDNKFMKSLEEVVYKGKFTDSSDIEGKNKVEIELTKGMLLSLYMHNRRNRLATAAIDTGNGKTINPAMLNSNQRHIMFGGMIVPDVKRLYDGKTSAALGDYSQGRITMTPEQIKEITDEYLSEKDKDYADACAAYFEFAKDETNRVSRKLEGMDIAKVDEYFPIVSNKDFINSDGYENVFAQSNSDSSSVLNPSTHKMRVEGASNPIMLMDITQVMKSAIDADARYVAEAIPLSNFNKVIGRNVYTENGMTSVREQIRRNAGDWYIKWINKWIDGISEKIKPMPKLVQKYMSHFAAAKLTGNWKVGLGQRFAYPAIEAKIGVKAASKAFKHFKGPWNNRAIDEDIGKYSPVMWSRGRGYSSTDVVDASKSVIFRKLGKLADTTTRNDLALMRRIWFACYEWGKAQANDGVNGFENVEIDSDEFKKLVAHKFEDVVMFTQNSFEYSQRGGILWRDNPLLAWFAMFRSDKMKYFSMTQSAFDNVIFRYEDYRNLKTSGASSEQLNAAKKEVGAAVKTLALTETAIAKANLLYLLFSRILYALYSPSSKDDEPFRDEKGNLSLINILIKYAEEIALDRIGQSGAALNFVADIIETQDLDLLGKYIVSGDDEAKKEFLKSLGGKEAVSIPAVDALNSVLGAAASVFENIDAWKDGDYQNALLDTWSQTKTLLEYLTGAPIGVVERYIKDGIYYTVKSFRGKEAAQAAVKYLFTKTYKVGADHKKELTDYTAKDLYSIFKTGDSKRFGNSYHALAAGLFGDGVDDISSINKKMYSLYGKEVSDGVKALDKAYDGKWSMKIQYQDGKYYKTVNISTAKALEDIRKKLKKKFNYDIMDKIDSGISDVPEGITISGITVDTKEMTDALYDIGAISEDEAREGSQGSDYGKRILDYLMADKWQEAADVWNAANEFNPNINVKTDGDKAEVMTKAVESEYQSTIKEKLLGGDKSVDGKFNVKIKWEDKEKGKTYEARATTVDDYFMYKKMLEESGYKWDDVSGDVIVNTDDIDNRLNKIGVADPVSHYGTEWYMSAYYTGDPAALNTYQKNAIAADKYEDWDAVKEDMHSGYKKDAQSFEAAGMEDEVNARIDGWKVESWNEDKSTNKAVTYDNYNDYKYAVAQLEEQGYTKKGKKSAMAYRVTRSYNYDPIDDFIEAAKTAGSYGDDWADKEKKAYMNYVGKDIINHQPISYETAYASPQEASSNAQSSDSTVGNAVPTEGEAKEGTGITYKSSSYTKGSGKSGGNKGKSKGNGGKKPLTTNADSLGIRSLITGEAYGDTVSLKKSKNKGPAKDYYRSLVSKYSGGAASKKRSTYKDIMRAWFGK